MRKYVGLGLLIFIANCISAQYQESVFEVEYEQNNISGKGIGFTIVNCKKEIIYKSWQNWVLEKGGDIPFFKKYEANNLNFQNTDNTFKNIMNMVEDNPNQITVIHAFTDQNLSSLSSKHPDFQMIFNKLTLLNFQTKKKCAEHELSVGYQDLLTWNKFKLDLEIKLSENTQLFYQSKQNLIELEATKNGLIEHLDLLENLISRTEDGVKVDRLLKKKNDLDLKLKKVKQDIFTNTGKLNLALKNKEMLTKEITKSKEKIDIHKTIIDSLTNNFEAIRL